MEAASSAGAASIFLSMRNILERFASFLPSPGMIFLPVPGESLRAPNFPAWFFQVVNEKDFFKATISNS